MSSFIGWFLFFTLCIYNLLDVYQSKLLFELGLMEANPILLLFMKSDIDWKTIAIIKTTILSALGILLFVHYKERKANVQR